MKIIQSKKHLNIAKLGRGRPEHGIEQVRKFFPVQISYTCKPKNVRFLGEYILTIALLADFKGWTTSATTDHALQVLPKCLSRGGTYGTKHKSSKDLGGKNLKHI